MAPRLLIRRQTAARSRLGSDGTWYTSNSQRPGCGLSGVADTASAAHVHRVDAGKLDADDDALLARLVHHAEVGLVLRAHLVGELVVVVATQFEVTIRPGRIQDEQRAFRPAHQVLGLLPRGVEGDGHAVVVREEPDLGELRPAVRADSREGGAVGAEQIAEILRDSRRHSSSIPWPGSRGRRNPATTAAAARMLRTGTTTAGARPYALASSDPQNVA